MAQVISVRLSKGDAPSLGFRLQGGKDFGTPLVVQKMIMNKTLIRCCFLYEYKLSTEAADAARNIYTAFVSTNGIMLFDHSGRPKIISNEDLKQVVETNSSTTCVELAENFNMSVAASSARKGVEVKQMGPT
ncbi:hypothetical protein Trydic_g8334 [Trypoxylus dichotomus]